MESKFAIWLQQNGAEILPCSNEYEEIRFKGSEIGVKYKSGKFSNLYASHADYCYKNNKKWNGRPVNVGRKSSYKKEKISIIKRDGLACFYCGELLGDDITLEHLISLTSGGLNQLSNMVLAHHKCNQKMNHKPLVDKVNYALKMRVKLLTKIIT
jgi:hypothetical protein